MSALRQSASWSPERVLVSEDLEVDPARGLFRIGERVREPPPKVMQLVLYLMRHSGRVVAKREVVEHLWSGVHVTDGSIRWVLKEARRALGDDGTRQRFIRTRRGFGLFWARPVSERSYAVAARPLHAFKDDQGIAAASMNVLEPAHEIVAAAASGHGSGVVWITGDQAAAMRACSDIASASAALGCGIARAHDDSPRDTPFAPWPSVVEALERRESSSVAGRWYGAMSTAPAVPAILAVPAAEEHDALRFWMSIQQRLLCALRARPHVVFLPMQHASVPALRLLRAAAISLRDEQLALVCWAEHDGLEAAPCGELSALREEVPVVEIRLGGELA